MGTERPEPHVPPEATAEETPSEPSVAPEATIDHDDVDDVIGVAAELKQQDENKLSVEDLKAVGRELDLDDHYVDRAVLTLEQRRKAEAKAAAEKKALLRKRLRVIGLGLSALLVIVTLTGYARQSSLRQSLAETQQKRAQVVNVMQRQEAVIRRFSYAAPTPEGEAELSGAENRVRIERKRYDEAAARYNADASGPVGSMTIGIFGLPGSLPLSDQVSEWQR